MGLKKKIEDVSLKVQDILNGTPEVTEIEVPEERSKKLKKYIEVIKLKELRL